APPAARPREGRMDHARARVSLRLDAVSRPQSAGDANLRGAMARASAGEEIIVSDARTAILDRIDRALRTARIPSDAGRASSASAGEESERATVDPPKRLWREGGQAGGTLIDRFVAEARVLGVETFVESSDDGVRRRLQSLIDGRRVLAWN